MWGLVAFLIGIAYGWWAPGTQDKSRLFVNGLVIGLVIGLVMAIIGYLSNVPALGVGGFVGLFLAVVIITALFVLGAWIGDVIERATTRRGTRRVH